MIMSDYLYELDNGKCIFNDNIECDDGLCRNCQYYYNVLTEYPEQIEMEEVIKKYGESKKKKRK